MIKFMMLLSLFHTFSLKKQPISNLRYSGDSVARAKTNKNMPAIQSLGQKQQILTQTRKFFYGFN